MDILYTFCVLFRLGLAGVIGYYSFGPGGKIELLLGVSFLIMAIAFIVKFLTFNKSDLSMIHKTKIWWNNLRLTHATTYIFVGVLLLKHTRTLNQSRMIMLSLILDTLSGPIFKILNQ